MKGKQLSVEVGLRWGTGGWNQEGQSRKALWRPPQFSSVAQLCLTLCDPMNRSTPGLPVHHSLPEFT